jgi:hypothetical protein
MVSNKNVEMIFFIIPPSQIIKAKAYAEMKGNDRASSCKGCEQEG